MSPEAVLSAGAVALPSDGAAPPLPRPRRWHSLDVVKGVALWAMIAHHFQEWTGGEVHGRFLGFERFAVTDLAPPLFALALGAGAALVGRRAQDASVLLGVARRWGEILLIGVILDLVLHGSISGRGVLPTLAILGLAVTLAVVVGVRQPWVWWTVSLGAAVLAVPSTALAGESPLQLLISGPFALPVYAVFASAGAALALGGIGRDEKHLPLFRAAGAVVVVGIGMAALGGAEVAPGGIWPPARYPGHLAFTVWGLTGSLVVWGVARALLTADRLVGVAAARAGRRTLVVFTAHFVVQVALRAAGVEGRLRSHAWGLAAWVAVLVVCLATALPPRRSREPRRSVS